MSFTYNDSGIRTSKTVNGVVHTYQLNGSQIVSEEWEDKLLVYLYDASGSPIGMMYRTTSYAEDAFDIFWFSKNLHGDIVAVYDNSGTKVASYEYSDAWGSHGVTYSNGGASTGAQYNPFRYRGYYYDTDLGMYYLQSRYYDSKICRYINADSALYSKILGCNLFAYCDNNPVSMVDPTGQYCVAIVDEDGNPLNDGLLDCGDLYGGGYGGGYGGTSYIGPGSAYHTYCVRSISSAYDAQLLGYHTNPVSSAALNPSYYYIAGAVSVTDSMATSKRGTTTLYRSVSQAEAIDIINTGKFNLPSNGMTAKQFGFDYGETLKFGRWAKQDIIVSARIPTNSLNRFYTQGVDCHIFRNGTLTVYEEDLMYFNQLVKGSIKIIK